jgi:hypothetical protein
MGCALRMRVRSVGQCAKGEYSRVGVGGDRAAILALQDAWEPVSFVVDRLSVIAREGFDDPFKVVAEVMLPPLPPS